MNLTPWSSGSYGALRSRAKTWALRVLIYTAAKPHIEQSKQTRLVCRLSLQRRGKERRGEERRRRLIHYYFLALERGYFAISFKSILTSVMSATLHPTRIDRIPKANRLHIYIKLPGDALFREHNAQILRSVSQHNSSTLRHSTGARLKAASFELCSPQ